MTTYDDFEDGDVAEWTVHDTTWGIDSSPSIGSYSGGVSESSGTEVYAERVIEGASGGAQPDTLSFRLRESSSSYGSGVRFITSGGNFICGFATNNPQWMYSDAGSTTQFYSGDGYDRWLDIDFNFDWANSQVTLTAYDPVSGYQESVTFGLNYSDVEKIAFCNFGGTGTWNSGGWNSGTSNCYSWIDNLESTGLETVPSAPSNVSQTINASDSIDVSFTDNSDGTGAEDNWRIQISRDGSNYQSPSGGPTTPAGDSNSGDTHTYNYNPNSDNAYQSQVGVDSSFKWRVRAENSTGNSSWAYSGTKYTTPISPHAPSVSRPSGGEVTIDWTVNSDFGIGKQLQYREDTGAGYGTWTSLPAESHVTLDVATNNDYAAIEGLSYSTAGAITNATFATWVNTTDSDAIIYTWDASEYFRFLIRNGNADIYLRDSNNNGTYYSSGINVADGNWHHIAATYDGGTNTLEWYIDGISVATNTSVPSSVGTGTTRYGAVGKNSEMASYNGSTSASGQDFTGSLDNIYYAENTLSQAEVKRLANGEQIDNGSLQFYYTTDEGSGATLTDQSGNGYNANVQNGGPTAWKTHTSFREKSKTLSTGNVLSSDARYQFRLRSTHPYGTSKWVYADYGNNGNVYFTDNYEDIFADYTGQTGAFALKAEQGPYSGTRHVESAGTANSHEGIYNTTVSLDTTVNQTITGWAYYDGATGLNGGVVCLDDTGAGYAAYIEPGSGDFLLGKISGTTTWQTTLNANNAVSYSSGWYQVELVVGSGGSHTATLYDSTGTQVTSVSASDTAYSPFHPGIWAFNNGLKLDLLEWDDGTTIGSDGFEQLGLTEWDTVSFTNSSGVADPNFVDPHASAGGPESNTSGRVMGINGAEQGSHYLFLESGDYVDKNLGDLSGESDVIIKLAVATNSADNTSASEGPVIKWYDGSAWNNLYNEGSSYNRQGWHELTITVPSSMLATDNRIRLQGRSGSGDYSFFDRLVVSDILHEYTTPAMPTGLALDTSIEDEITASWTSNATFIENNDVYIKRTSATSWNGTRISPTTSYTWTGRDDGEKYDVKIEAVILQDRHGNGNQTQFPNATQSAATTLLPAPTTLTADTVNATSIDISWTANHDYGNTRVEIKRTSDTTWTNDSGKLSRTTTSYSITSLLNGEKYDIRVIAYTEHTLTIDQ